MLPMKMEAMSQAILSRWADWFTKKGLRYSKDAEESKLKEEKNVLYPRTIFFCYWNGDKIFAPYLNKDVSLVYCKRVYLLDFDIGKRFPHAEFDSAMKNLEQEAQLSFKEAVSMFLGNKDLFTKISQEICWSLRRFHFMNSHLEFSLKIVQNFMKIRVKDFISISKLERWYQRHWDIGTMVDSCWVFYCDIPETNLQTPTCQMTLWRKNWEITNTPELLCK